MSIFNPEIEANRPTNGPTLVDTSATGMREGKLGIPSPCKNESCKSINIGVQEKKQDRKISMKAAAIILQIEIAFFITLVLILFAGFRDVGFDRDSLIYALSIQSIDFSSFSGLNFNDKEPSFYLIAYAAHWLFGDAIRGTFLIYAILGVTLKIIGIYRLSRIPLLSVFFYVCSYYLLHELTQIRVGIAAAIFLLAIPDIANSRFKSYLTKTVIAIIFHYSAIIMFLVYPIASTKGNKWFFYILPICGIFLSLAAGPILDFIITHISFLELIPSFLSYKLILYLGQIQKNINVQFNWQSIYHLSIIVFYYFSFINLNRFKSNIDIAMIKVLGFSLFVFYAFSFLPVLAYRLSEFLLIVMVVLVVSVIYIFKQKIILIIFVVLYSIYGLIYLLFIQKLFTISI